MQPADEALDPYDEPAGRVAEAVLDGVVGSSVKTVASGVATSAPIVPKLRLAGRRHPCGPGELTSATITRSRSATSSKSTLSSRVWLRVSCTIAIDPTRRTASSSAARPSGT